MIKKGKRYTLNNIYYYFNFERYKERYFAMRRNAPKKEAFDKELAIRFGVGSVDTIKDWKEEKHSPQTIDIVKQIAKTLDIDYTKPLIPDEEDKPIMNDLDAINAKNAARALYAEFCDMIDSLEWEDPMSMPDAGPSHSNPNIKNLGLKSHDDYRHYIKKAIKKASLDLPSSFRQQLVDFTDECIGPEECSDPMFPFFAGDQYKQYLLDNDVEDNADSRIIYSVVHSQNMLDKLDEIFKDFICK